MHLYSDKDLTSIMGFDILHMLGLSELPESEKEKFLTKVESLTFQFFLQEKVGEYLSEEKLKELMELPLEVSDDFDKLMSAIGEDLPNAGELLLEASTEVKARLVSDQYESKHENLEKLLAEESDDNKKAHIEKKLAETRLNIELIKKGEWGYVNQLDKLDLSNISSASL